eukprot:scaffold36386_cov20-Tisochrysis_lutea.AAC.1
MEHFQPKCKVMTINMARSPNYSKSLFSSLSSSMPDKQGRHSISSEGSFTACWGCMYLVHSMDVDKLIKVGEERVQEDHDLHRLYLLHSTKRTASSKFFETTLYQHATVADSVMHSCRSNVWEVSLQRKDPKCLIQDRRIYSNLHDKHTHKTHLSHGREATHVHEQ